MPVELRKRKAPAPAPAPAPAAAKRKTQAGSSKAGAKGAKGAKDVSSKAAKVVESVVKTVNEAVATVTETVVEATNGAAAGGSSSSNEAPVVGEKINLVGFGGEIETNDGKKTTLEKLVEESKGGVVLFTYPKASTPGCTKQVCFFRDAHDAITSAGFAVYGLSADSTKANTTFKTNQKAQYTLLSDQSSTLIKAIGLAKSPKGTQRGVFVVDKAGKILAAEPGSPQGTVDVVKKIVTDLGASPAETHAIEKNEAKAEKKEDDEKKAEVASEVADTAAQLDK